MNEDAAGCQQRERAGGLRLSALGILGTHVKNKQTTTTTKTLPVDCVRRNQCSPALSETSRSPDRHRNTSVLWKSSKCNLHRVRLKKQRVTSCPVAAPMEAPAHATPPTPPLMSFFTKPWLREANGLLSSQMGRKSQNYANCLRFHK